MVYPYLHILLDIINHVFIMSFRSVVSSYINAFYLIGYNSSNRTNNPNQWIHTPTATSINNTANTIASNNQIHNQQQYYTNNHIGYNTDHPQYAHTSSSYAPGAVMPKRLPGFSNNSSSAVIATIQPTSSSLPVNANGSNSSHITYNSYNKNNNRDYNRVVSSSVSTPIVTVRRNPSPASHRIVKKKIYL